MLISYILPAFFIYPITKWDQSCKFRDIGQNIKILVKNRVDFHMTFISNVTFSLHKLFVKSKRIVFKYYFNPVSNIPSA